MNRNKPKVAVVIIHWNRRNLLEQFIPSILASTYPNLDIYVADNYSTDDSILFLQTNYPQVNVIKLDHNYGYAGGYNRTLVKITADYYILLNNDIEVTPSWIEPIIEHMEQDHSIGAAQPKMLDYNQRNRFEYAGAAGGFMDFLGYPFCRGRLLDTFENDEAQYNTAIPVFWATGACLFVRANVFHEVNGFDEHFFAHMEEIDLCWRMQLKGYSSYCFPQSSVFHLGGGTLDKMNPHKTYLNFRNNLIMLTKNSPIKTLLWLIPIRSFLDLVASIWFLVNGKIAYSLAIHKAHAHYFFRLGFWWKLRSMHTQTYTQLIGLYNRSMIWQYIVNRKRTYSSLPKA